MLRLRALRLPLVVVVVSVLGMALAQTGFIQVRAQPGIQVFLDDLLVGVTNADAGGLILLDVRPGVRRLRFVQEGFLPQDVTVTVTAGQVLLYEVGSLVPRVQVREEGDGGGAQLRVPTGTVVVQCLPIECVVDLPALGIAGRRKTQDRLVLEGVPAGLYEGRLTVGSQELPVSFGLCGGDTVSIFGRFVPTSVGVEVSSRSQAVWPSCETGVQFGTSANDYTGALAVDTRGRLVVAGYTMGSLAGTNAGSEDAFVRVMDADGREVWSRQFGTNAMDLAGAVAVDSRGRVAVAGMTFGGLFGVAERQGDAFVRVLDADGREVWSRQFGTNSFDGASGVAVDSRGRVVVAGTTIGSLAGAVFGNDAFVRVFDAAGREVWTRQFGTRAHDHVTGVAVDSRDRVVVVGNTEGALAGASGGGYDAFVRVLDADGHEVWTRQFGTSADDSASAVVVDLRDRVVIVGDTSGALAGPSAGGQDAFVRVFDQDGREVWTRQFGTRSDDHASAVAVDSIGRLVVVGNTGGALAGTNAGQWDAFVRVFDADGGEVWSRQFGTSASDWATSVAVDLRGRVVVAGSTSGALAGASAGGQDVFVRFFSVP